MRAVSKIILGTAQFGLNYGINNKAGKPSESTVAEILDRALTHNIRLLDTAEAYGDSQEVIGRYHQTAVERFEVITKFGHLRTDLPTSLEARVDHDLQTLRVDHLYAYMFHSFHDFQQLYTHHRGQLATLKRTTKIQRLGVSVYTNDELTSLLDIDDVDLIQIPFNLLDNISLRGELLKKAKDRGKEIHTRSAFLQGLFFMDTQNLPANLAPLAPALESIRRIAAAHATTPEKLALAYVLQQDSIDHVLIGVDNGAQLERNVVNLPNLPITVLQEIDQLNVPDISLLNPSTWKISKS